MDNIELIKEFFSKIRCTRCNSTFNNESIKVMRNENGYLVVRITCPKCDKNIGMAMLGVEKENASEDNQLLNAVDSPISYDEVIDAHKFFFNLGDDWGKYLPKD